MERDDLLVSDHIAPTHINGSSEDGSVRGFTLSSQRKKDDLDLASFCVRKI